MTPKVAVKESIAHVCMLLGVVGAPGLRPETVRLAKFDSAEPAVHQELWACLHDVCVCVAAGFPASAADARDALTQLRSAVAVEANIRMCISEAAAGLVRRCLGEWGCPVPGICDMTPAACSSRGILLALGWLIARFEVFHIGLERLLAAYPKSAPLPPYPDDTAQLPSIAEAGSATEARATQHVGALLQATEVQHAWRRVQAQANTAVMLHSQVGTLAADTAALQQARRRVAYQAHRRQELQSRDAAAPTPPLSPYELTLTKSKTLMQAHIEAMDGAAGRLGAEKDTLHHSRVFYAWLGSVAAEAAAVAAQAPATEPGLRRRPSHSAEAAASGGEAALAQALTKAADRCASQLGAAGVACSGASEAPHAQGGESTVLAGCRERARQALAGSDAAQAWLAPHLRVSPHPPQGQQAVQDTPPAVLTSRCGPGGAWGKPPSGALQVDVRAETGRLQALGADVAEQLRRARRTSMSRLRTALHPLAANSVILGFD